MCGYPYRNSRPHQRHQWRRNQTIVFRIGHHFKAKTSYLRRTDFWTWFVDGWKCYWYYEVTFRNIILVNYSIILLIQVPFPKRVRRSFVSFISRVRRCFTNSIVYFCWPKVRSPFREMWRILCVILMSMNWININIVIWIFWLSKFKELDFRLLWILTQRIISSVCFPSRFNQSIIGADWRQFLLNIKHQIGVNILSLKFGSFKF